MQYSPDEIKDRLLKALDKDNNVVDMVAVLDIITYLEEHTITKEALEQTRLGRYVNELRKKTKNDDLAKRAKKLVRNWQKLITAPSTTEGPVNGERLATARSASSLVDGVKRQELRGNISPALSASRPTTPYSKSNTSPNNLVSQPGTPTSVTSSRSQTPLSSAQRLVLNNVRNKPASPALSAIKSNIVTKSTSLSSPALKPSNNDLSRNCTPQSLDKTNAANKKRRRDEVADLGNNKKVKSSVSNNDVKVGNNSKDYTPDWILERESVLNGAKEPKNCLKVDVQLAKTAAVGATKPAFGSNVTNLPLRPSVGSTKSDSEKSLQTTEKSLRTPKVKTTAQLIADLQAKSSSNISSVTMNKITHNQIQKEPDFETVSIVPAGAKPRPRRKPGTNIIPPAASDSALSQTKKEMMHKFLQSAVPPQGSLESVLPSAVMGKHDLRTVSPTFSDLQSHSDNYPPVNQTADSISDESKRNDSKVVKRPKVKLIDPYTLLPPLDLEKIVWDDEDYVVPEQVEATEEAVTKMQEDECPGLNGVHDSTGSWRTWAQMYTVPTMNDEVLHILPYVDIGD